VSMSINRWTRTWPFALCGLLAAAAGMAVGHLVAAFVNPAASPVLAVGSTVIDATPTPVKEWAIKHFGTNDKPILLLSVAIVTALAAAGIGVLSRRRPTPALVLIVGLAALAGLAAMARPAALPQDIVPALVAAITGAATLAWLRGRLVPRTVDVPRAVDVPRTVDVPRAVDAPEAGATAPESPLDHTAYAPGSPSTPPRRTFLLGAAAVTAGAAVAGAIGQNLSAEPALPTTFTLPRPQKPLPPLPTGIEEQVKGVSPFRTPTNDFYRVDTALVIPRVDVSSWQLHIDGDVEQPMTLSFKQLLAMPMIEQDITLNCVSNEVGGPFISSTRWLGVRVRDLLETAKVKPGVEQILSESTDGMTISTPIQALTDSRDAIIAVAMDGKPLPARHGFPARMVTPGLYGYVGATKWVTRLTATTYAAQQAYWTQRGWAEKADVKTQARIDTPMGLATYRQGKIAVGGVAWAQGRGIEGVEVRVDQGPWQKATLGPDGGTDYWRQWYYVWDATSGRHELTVRATDGTGTPQTQTEAAPFPNGAAGYHSVVVLVS
jgi:DMSO/TMAO reductase YedYZ molybdopterin-dependent catalytic subunit